MLFVKDPSAVLDFYVDWSAWLAEGDTISASTWTVPDGLTHVSASDTDTAAAIWLSGGELGQTYVLTNRITTAAGRVDERSLRIEVRDR